MTEADGLPDPPAPRSRRRRVARNGLWLAITGISLYLVVPTVLDGFSSWDQLSRLGWGWLLAVGLLQLCSFACVWGLQAIALRSRDWFPLITSQLAGNAASRVVPGGGAAGFAVQFGMLRTAGIARENVASGLTAMAVLQFGTTLLLPVLTLPSVLWGRPVAASLERIALFGAGFFVVAFAAAVVFMVADGPLRLLGRTVERVHNATFRQRPRFEGLPERLISERDQVRSELGRNWAAASALSIGRAAFDFVSLLAALQAVGAESRATLVLLGYTAALLLALIPLTPGGLGFVEAGLTGMLTLAGVPAGQAVTAALLYRFATFWLPIPVGLVAGAAFRARYGRASSNGRPAPG